MSPPTCQCLILPPRRLLVRLQVLSRACQSLNFTKKRQQQLFSYFLPLPKAFYVWSLASCHLSRSCHRLLWTMQTAWLEDVSACAAHLSSRSLGTGDPDAVTLCPPCPRRSARIRLDVNQVLYGTKDEPGPFALDVPFRTSWPGPARA